jgi:O-antigen chain-terminating methyltransferase
MAPPDPEIDVEEIMARVRATLDDQEQTDGSPSDRAVVLAPSFNLAQLLLDQAQRVADVGKTVPPFGGLPAPLRPLARVVTRALHFLLQVITVDQRVFNALVVNVLRMSTVGLGQAEAKLNARLGELHDSSVGARTRIGRAETAGAERDASLADLRTASDDAARTIADLQRTIADLQARLDESNRERDRLNLALQRAEQQITRAEQRITEEAAALAEVQRRGATLQLGIAAQERRLRDLAGAAERSLAAGSSGASEVAALAGQRSHLLDAFYASFEERFRGDLDDIGERVRIYVADVRAVGGGTPERPVLDLGCGRGEWLEVLRDEQLCGRGIDSNATFIERCRARGLDAVHGDVVEVLRSLPENSVGAVTAFHLAEHLHEDTLVEMVDEMVRVLLPGGVAIVETPNPENVLVGSCRFYLDPTHRRPLPSPFLHFLFEARGLHQVEVRPLHPAPDGLHPADSELAARVNRLFYGPQDYAVLGVKP